MLTLGQALARALEFHRTGRLPRRPIELRQKHIRFLAAHDPGAVGAYWAACLDDDPAVGQRMFDAVDARMRRAGWDDMRQWKQQAGIAA